MKETIQELNDLGVSTIQNLTKAGHFEKVRICDELIAQHQDSKDLNFFFQQQRELNEAYGEITVEFYTLKAKLKTFIAVHKNGKRLLAASNGTKVPSDVSLEDEAIAEVSDLNVACVILQGWVERASNSIKTCRSHTYTNDPEKVDKDRYDE